MTVFDSSKNKRKLIRYMVHSSYFHDKNIHLYVIEILYLLKEYI